MDKKLFRTIVASGSALIVVAFIILRYEGFFEVINFILKTVRPIILGIVIAFILNRPLSKIDEKFKEIRRKKNKPIPNKPLKISILSIYIITLLVIGGIIGIVVPQLVISVKGLSDNFDIYYRNFQNIVLTVSKYLDVEWLQQIDFLGQLGKIAEYIPDIVEKTVDVTTGIVNGVIDFVIGLVLSIYILADKIHLKHQANLIAKRLLKENTYLKTVHFLKIGQDSFSNFISGQLVEACILGIICFIGMNIFRFDYSLLISTVIGVTNIIPIAGPILGTVPCAFILLLVEPKQALWFIVFIIILQQLESNLIYPRVVGTSIGLPAMWVLIAVIVGGGLYGVLGMVIFIPLMSVIYGILREHFNSTSTENEPEIVETEIP